MIKPMPEGQRPFPMPMRELERRWAAVRGVLKDRDVEALFIQSDTQDFGGYVRWLTDQAAGYPVNIVFPRDGGMTMITSGDPNFPPKPGPGVERHICDGYFRSIAPTNYYDIELVDKILREMGAKRVGYANLGRLHACSYKYMIENMGDIEFVDLTDEIDLLKAVKSPVELEYIEYTARIHDDVLSAIPLFLRPGRMEYEIRNDLCHLSNEMGGEGQICVLCGSAPKGQVINYGPLAVQNRRIEYGDQFMAMFESSGPGGYFCEMSRYWSIGEPDGDLVRGWETARQAQRLAAGLLRPGADLRQVFNAGNEFLESRGYCVEGRIMGHGQGHDLMERPGIQRGETMPAAENMVFAIHPSAIRDGVNVFCCDNYVVTAEGGRRLQKLPQEIFII